MSHFKSLSKAMFKLSMFKLNLNSSSNTIIMPKYMLKNTKNNRKKDELKKFRMRKRERKSKELNSNKKNQNYKLKKSS